MLTFKLCLTFLFLNYSLASNKAGKQKFLNRVLFFSFNSVFIFKVILNHWPLSNLNDIVGDAHLLSEKLYSFVDDRFGNPGSAIAFSDGNLLIPSGVYFNGDFTITAWFNLKSHPDSTSLIRFGNGFLGDNIEFIANKKMIRIREVKKDGQSAEVSCPYFIESNKWYHVALKLKHITGYIYVNGVLVQSDRLFTPRSIIRRHTGTISGDATFDEIKIYRGALTSEEIANEYNQNESISKSSTKSISFNIYIEIYLTIL